MLFLTVINASHTFYNSKTQLSSNEMDNPVKKWYSRTLNNTCEPEEKRKIIGDTFIQVCRELCSGTQWIYLVQSA